jgi:hypothetical protein
MLMLLLFATIHKDTIKLVTIREVSAAVWRNNGTFFFFLPVAQQKLNKNLMSVTSNMRLMDLVRPLEHLDLVCHLN